MPIEQNRVAEDFSRAAHHYDEHAHLQHSVMIDACLLAGHYFEPEWKILDVGCGTGSFALHAKTYDKKWDIIGIDIAPAMVEKAKQHAPSYVANAEEIPFDNATFDAIFSGVCLQWINNKPKALAEMARVTRTGGKAVITIFGANTLVELRRAMQTVGMEYSVMELPALDYYRDAAKQAGWNIKSAQQSVFMEYVANVEQIMFQLRRIGATNKHKKRPKHLFGLRRFEQMIAAYEKQATPLGIPVTWDVISLVLEKA